MGSNDGGFYEVYCCAVVVQSGVHIRDIHTMNILPHDWLVNLIVGHYSAVRSLCLTVCLSLSLSLSVAQCGDFR